MSTDMLTAALRELNEAKKKLDDASLAVTTASQNYQASVVKVQKIRADYNRAIDEQLAAVGVENLDPRVTQSS